MILTFASIAGLDKEFASKTVSLSILLGMFYIPVLMFWFGILKRGMILNRIEKKISWGDLDSLCIVFYPKYYEWMDGCSHLYFEKIGLDLVKLWHERQLIFGLVSTSCEYFRPGRYHQEIIIETVMEKLEKKTITMSHAIIDKYSGKIMVKGFEKRICMNVHNLDQFSAMDIPADLFQIFNAQL